MDLQNLQVDEEDVYTKLKSLVPEDGQVERLSLDKPDPTAKLYFDMLCGWRSLPPTDTYLLTSLPVLIVCQKTTLRIDDNMAKSNAKLYQTSQRALMRTLGVPSHVIEGRRSDYEGNGVATAVSE